jgi:hypothetical protein
MVVPSTTVRVAGFPLSRVVYDSVDQSFDGHGGGIEALGAEVVNKVGRQVEAAGSLGALTHAECLPEAVGALGECRLMAHINQDIVE